MKKPLIALGVALLLAAGVYAQTQRVNRTNTRTHDRSDAANPSTTTPATDKTTTRPDRMNQQNDVDRNNTNNNTNTTTPNGTGTTNGNSNSNGTSTHGTNTNGGTGTNGANINSNNPR